eukprot:XP_011680210.1 PREDICTED: myosin-8-like [Strongylocentrotus purpuratus]
MVRMRDEVGRLKQQLQQAKNQQPPPRPPPQPPAVMTQVDSRSAPPGIDPRVRDQMQRLQGDVANLRNQLQNKDRMAAQQLADAENDIIQLQAELRKREQEARAGERSKKKAGEREAREAELRHASALAQAEIEGGHLAQRAINELAKAQEEIDGLEEVLSNRERELEETLHHGETASHAIGPQTATDLQNLLGEIAGLRQALDGQQHHMNNRGQGRVAPLPPFIPAADPAFNDRVFPEDEIDRLRKQLDKLKRSKRTERQSSPNTSGRMSRLRHELMDKREELDALDLAVSRQQGALNRLRDDDEDLRYQTEAKLRELKDLGRNVDERKSRRDFLEHRRQFVPRAEDYDEVDDHQRMQQSAFLEDEIECLEDTIAKRRAELREADQLLLQCQTDLHEAQNKASETLRHYDKATHDLAMTREESEELERRSHEVAVTLVQAQERLLVLEREVEELEEKRRTCERDAGEMETLLNGREMEMRAVEAKRDQSSKRLERLKSEVIMAEQKLSELQSSLRDGEREHSNRQSELDRLQDQLDDQQHALEKVNREIGAKQTDLRTLTSETDKQRQQLVSALQEGESEISATQQKIKDTKNNLERLRQQRQETSQAVDQRREELSRLQTRLAEAEGAHHDVQSAIEKQQAELKHTLEMVHIEKTELEALRMQHEAKMAELEKTQLAALQVSSVSG